MQEAVDEIDVVICQMTNGQVLAAVERTLQLDNMSETNWTSQWARRSAHILGDFLWVKISCLKVCFSVAVT